MDVRLSSGSGFVSNRYRSYGFAQVLTAQPVYMQAWALDATQPGGVSASNGVALTLPQPPTQLPEFSYLVASDRAMEQSVEAIQAMGGAGYLNDNPTGRIMRDAKLMQIGAGTQEIRRMLIGRELFAATA